MRQICSSGVVLGLFAIVMLLNSSDVMACASCGCTLSPDWQNLQFSSTSGLKIDLRWDYLNQNQLRSGTGTISPIAASQQNGFNQEVERLTRNNYFTLGLDYSINPSWGLNVQIPWVDRKHSTFGVPGPGWDGSSIVPGSGAYDSHTSNLGDIKVIGRYQGLNKQGNIGILFGFKLPTGSYTKMGSSSDPTAPGPVPIDRGLQPGTGTTDAILGAYYINSLTRNLDYFAQVLAQAALYSKDEYRPGNNVNLTLGLRYLGFSMLFPQLQLNFRAVRRDSGANADTISTGGTLLYLSPGIDVPVSAHFSVYSFVQVPVYQNLNGVQLAPHYTTSLGVRYSF